MGTRAECGCVSLLALLVHLHISAWKWQHREQPDIIIQSLECTQLHSTPIIKVYFASREAWHMYSVHVYMNRAVLQTGPWDGISVGVLMGGIWIAFPPNKQRASSKSKQLTLRAGLKPMWCNRVTPRRHHRQTDGKECEVWCKLRLPGDGFNF